MLLFGEELARGEPGLHELLELVEEWFPSEDALLLVLSVVVDSKSPDEKLGKPQAQHSHGRSHRPRVIRVGFERPTQSEWNHTSHDSQRMLALDPL